jgi:intein/homing endonuclease
MIDFNKKIVNSDKFRPAAIYYEKHKTFCPYPFGTAEYVKYWDEATERSLNGYTSPDGDYIPGYYYFYLNYSPILRLVEREYTDRYGNVKKRRIRDRSFPDFYDYDYYYFSAIQEAEDTGQHMVVLKARGKGYSFKGGSMLCRNYYLIPESKSYAVASEKEYLTKDGLLTKASEFMDFIDKNTAWAKKRITDTTMQKRSGIVVTDELGNKTEQGYRSEIMGISLKNSPDRIRGKRGKLILWEEAGMFKDILTAWQIARPGIEEDGTAFGLMIAFGTGGSEGDDFRGLRELFYKPDGYNVLSFPNIWDENVADNKCGFFVPAWTNMSTVDKETGERLYMDKDGNSDAFKAMDFLLAERKKVVEGATDNEAIDRYIAEHPIRPQEACLEISGNIFPKKDLMQQLSLIRTNKKLQSHKQVGDLSWVNGELVWNQKKNGDITQYPLPRDADPTGAIVIWEHPQKNPPPGLYIAGCLLPGEKVITNNGLVNVENVSIGSKLISQNGNEVDIINHQRYYKKDVNTYTIHPFGSYRSTTFTEEHPIFTDSGFIKSKDLVISNKLIIPNRYMKETETYKDVLQNYNITNALELWWFFGLWLGDGFTNINRNSYDIYITFGKDQVSESKYCINIVHKVFDRKCIITKNGNTVRFTSKKLVNLLDNEFGKYAEYKQIPEWIKLAPEQYKKAFILGYLDSDGSVFLDRDKQNISFTSINLELLESIQDILFGLKIANSITLHSKEGFCKFNNIIYPTKQSYKLKVCRNNVGMFENIFKDKIGFKINKLIKEDFTENKYIKFIGSTIELNIKKVDHNLYTGYVYNFECETHTYMSRCIVTHNCDPLMIAVLLNIVRIG